MSKLESEEIVLENKDFDINRLLHEIREVIEKQVYERGISLSEKEYNLKYRYLNGSPVHLKRILMNIISNAVKYNKEKEILLSYYETQEDDVSIEGMRILLAEDNELNMEIAEFLLTNAGAVIIRASNGKEAVEAFAKSGVGEVNVILMDIMMPVMDGMEATREIRTMNRSDASAVVIIAMTANAFTEDKTKALKSGMDDYLTKPLESEKLIRALSRYKHN